MESAEPTQPIERNEPTERIEHALPTEPIERNDDFEPMLRNELRDHRDAREPSLPLRAAGIVRAVKLR
jgi:hypothetical protein